LANWVKGPSVLSWADTPAVDNRQINGIDESHVMDIRIEKSRKGGRAQVVDV
jgi:hypothetical protein